MTLLFLGLLGGLFHVAGSGVHSFEAAAAQDISAKLQGSSRQVHVKADVGPEALWGDLYSVRIEATKFETDGLPLYTESKRSHRGLVRNLHLELRDFSLKGLHIDRLSADIPGCRYDFPLAVRHRQIRLSQSGTGEGEVVIGERDLESFILSKFPEIKRANVKIDRGEVVVEGYGEFLVIATNFRVAARLEVADGNKLVLAGAQILFDGRIADDASQRVLLDTLNPVVDLDKDLALFGAITVKHIELRDGQLIASGPIRIPELPAKNTTETGTKLRSGALLQE
jgi:hypothetical protein